MPDISPDLPFSISLRRVNQCVGYVALLLPLALVALTLLGGLCFRASISHYYFSRLGGDLFVGALVFVGLLLAAFYDFEPQETEGCLQHRWYDLWLVRLAGICALGVAFVPTADSGCAYQPSDVARVFLTQPQGSETASVPGGRVTGTISHGLVRSRCVLAFRLQSKGIADALDYSRFARTAAADQDVQTGVQGDRLL